MNLILKAARFAAEKHQDQRRKWTDRPYIEHPMRVAGRASITPGLSEFDVCAAWLNDVIEDCGVLRDELVHEFNPEIADIVVELTNPSKERPDLIRSERKAMDRTHIRHTSQRARVLRLIDRLDNVRDMEKCPNPGFRKLYFDETLLLCDALQSVNPVINGLRAEIVSEIKKYACFR